MLRRVAVTGGLSCGKSSVCRLMKDLGAYVVSADEIVHQLLSPTTELGKKVVSLLGDEIIHNGLIDRSIVAKKVFNEPVLLASLESLLHPAVMEEIERQYQQALKTSSAPLFVAEIPLLFEINGEKNFQIVISVHADPETCFNRFHQAPGRTKSEFLLRMSRQLSSEEKAKRANFVINNSGSLEDLKKDVTDLYHQLINQP